MEIGKIQVQNQQPPPQAKPAQEQDTATPTAQGTQVDEKSAPKKVVNDSVDISSVAKKMQQEATETAAQTAMEAAKGDKQAKKLLVKEAEAKEQNTPHEKTQDACGNFDHLA